VDPLNSQPFFVLGSTSVSVVEGSDNSVALIGGVTLTDADDVRASAVISVIAPQEGDVLSVSDSQALGVSIATDGLSATVAITEFASLVDALQAISYASAANFTNPLSRNISVSVFDAGSRGQLPQGNASSTMEVVVHITPVNNAPVISGPVAPAQFTEGQLMPSDMFSKVNISDSDDVQLSAFVQLITSFPGDSLELSE